VGNDLRVNTAFHPKNTNSWSETKMTLGRRCCRSRDDNIIILNKCVVRISGCNCSRTGMFNIGRL